MCQAIMRCKHVKFMGGAFGLLVEGGGGRDGGRGEARLTSSCARKVVEKGKGKWRWRSPTATSTHFCPPQRSLNCASPFSFTLPLKIGVVSASQPPEMSLGWKGSRPCQKKAITGTGGARQSAGEYVKGGRAVLRRGLGLEIAVLLCGERLPRIPRRGRPAPWDKGPVLTSHRLPNSCDLRRRS